MKEKSDYGHPLKFFATLGLLCFFSYHIEKHMGMGMVIVLAAWFVITAYMFAKIQNKGLECSHPANFFAWIITFTLTGAYISLYLNAETFVILTFWFVAYRLAARWLQETEEADKRLFNLLSVQFLALAFIAPILLQASNRDLIQAVHHAKETPAAVTQGKTEHQAEGHAPVAHGKTEHQTEAHAPAANHESTEQTVVHTADQQTQSLIFQCKLLKVLEYAIAILSLWIALCAWRLGRQRGISSDKPCCADETVAMC